MGHSVTARSGGGGGAVERGNEPGGRGRGGDAPPQVYSQVGHAFLPPQYSPRRKGKLISDVRTRA
jgi:hypothetical protein